jgi:Cu(I)/Ag(I) efflux system membrane protein CusA/SilA
MRLPGRDRLDRATLFKASWSGECEFPLRAKERKIILPVVFFVIFLPLYMVFHNLTEAMALIFPVLCHDRRADLSVSGC